MKVLLLNPPNLEENQVEAQTIPLGLFYIKEFILQEGHDIDILNLYSKKSWRDVSSLLERINFQVIGIPCYTRQRFSVFKLAEICKKIKENSTVLLGGPHATFLDTQILNRIDAVDYVVRKEGELTFSELLNVLEKGDYSTLHKIRGLTFRQNGKIIKTPPRKNIENLSEFPPPQFTKKQLESLPKCESLAFHFRKIKNHGSIAPILASRGCDNNCLFCCSGGYWKKQNYYSPEYTFNQMYNFNKKFDISVFDLYDDDFTHSEFHVNTICDLIIKHKLNVFWWCSSRAKNIDKELLLKMKKAGCFMISYGLESGSHKILESINKDITIKENIDTANLTKEAELKLRLSVSIGHPGEDLDSIKETISFLKQTKPDQVALYLTKIYPGAPLYRTAKRNGFITDDYWFDDNKLTVPFYTAETSLEKLLAYRNMIEESLKNNIVYQIENKVYSLELDLEW